MPKLKVYIKNTQSEVKVPVGMISMMFSLTLRFIPTLVDETRKIMKAQASRGVDFNDGSLKSDASLSSLGFTFNNFLKELSYVKQNQDTKIYTENLRRRIRN